MSNICKRSVDFSKWYTSVVIESNLVDYGLAKGTMIIKPYGWSIWKSIEFNLDEKIKETGTENCMFPLFIPYSKFAKEKEHIKGFSPELFKIDYIGDEKLDDSLIIRPTSEISFCDYFSKLSISYQDLPIKLNQWCNAFRVEKNTRPFLRTSEFFWQEQHAIFEDKDSAINFSLEMIKTYKNFINEYLCIPTLMGYKTNNERFSGAEITYTNEAIMQDGQALQISTSHFLSQNFSIPFNIKYQNKNNKFNFVYQTSAGTSTRLMGALIMVHSDDSGLVLPFKIAPYQYVINLIDVDKSNSFVNEILDFLNNQKYRIKIDDSKKTFGFKINKYEIQGCPFQIIIGKKEIDNKQVTFYRRDTKEKFIFDFKDVLDENKIKNLSLEYDKNLFDKAKIIMNDLIVDVNDFELFKKAINNKKVVLVNWSGSDEDELEIKKLTGATIRCVLDIDYSKENLECFYTKKKNAKKVYFARAY